MYVFHMYGVGVFIDAISLIREMVYVIKNYM
jgi:hypothetical protein